MRYSGGIIDGTKEELQDMDQKTRKIMTLKRRLHPRSSVARDERRISMKESY